VNGDDRHQDRDDRRFGELLPRFSLERRVAVLVFIAAALVVGVVAALGIPLELIPRGFQPPTLVVQAPWRDAPPREVLDKVVLPLEEELSTVGGLADLSSISSTASARLFLTFSQGTDMDVAYREVRDRLVRARPRLPEDLERVFIHKHDDDSVPVMLLGIALDPRVSDPYELIKHEIIAPLSRVDGVAAVKSDGLRQKEVLIELDRERTQAAGLNIYQIARELSSDNFAIASGEVRDGGRELLLRSVARYRDIQEIEDQLIAPGVRLSDVGRVVYEVPEREWQVRVNGKPALAIEVLKEGQANTVEVGRRLAAAFAELERNPRLQTSELAILFSQSEIILESLGTLLASGRVGAIFAALVLLFFLRRFRLTLIITLAIPVSLVIALVVMYFSGETLNVLSLLGLIISVGLLVDNSVVVAENIHRLHQDGLPRRRACIRGAAEIALAITLATLTTIIVFLPVSLVEGRAQFFLMRLSIPIAVSLAASLVVALVLVPLSVYLTMGARKGGADGRGPIARLHTAMDAVLGGIYGVTLEPLSRLYSRLLAFFLRRRLDLVLLLAVALVATGAAQSRIEVVDISEDDQRGFRIQVFMPPTHTFEDSEQLFRDIERSLAEAQDELGLEGYFVLFGRNYGELQAWFPTDSTGSRREGIARGMELMPERPGVRYYSGREERGADEDRFVYKVILSGEDPDRLAEFGEELEQILRRVEGVVGARRAEQPVPNQIGLVVDRDRAQRQGVNPQVIAGVVAYALRGVPLPRLHQEGREVPVRLRFEEEDRKGLAQLSDFAVPTADGRSVQLQAVTDPSFLAAARRIHRRDKRISYEVTLDLAEEDVEETRQRVASRVERLDLPEGVRLGATQSAESLDDDMKQLRMAALMSILFVYLLMGFLFESFLLPLSILFTIPLAAVGVVWAHVWVGRDLDFLGFVGVILLIGVVVNNGIVLVDYINRLRREGIARTEALLLATRRRFRPIMMTALTTICGMIPLAIGERTSIGISYKSFGLTLIGGLATATALTLLVIPVFYSLLDDARARAGALLTRALRRR
jgi:hydrophobic/amphiphilic exporter-1 (mainly G- bacteria), HAE1 family